MASTQNFKRLAVANRMGGRTHVVVDDVPNAQGWPLQLTACGRKIVQIEDSPLSDAEEVREVDRCGVCWRRLEGK